MEKHYANKSPIPCSIREKHSRQAPDRRLARLVYIHFPEKLMVPVAGGGLLRETYCSSVLNNPIVLFPP